MLSGVVQTGGYKWQVREEKRQGPRGQIFILTAVDAPVCEMHIRPMPGTEAKTIEEVQLLAGDPAYRWFADADERRWEVRLVIRTEPNGIEVMLAKFISGTDVYEGEYSFRNGLGMRTDEELRELLCKVRRER
jgi:hypothetical protein